MLATFPAVIFLVNVKGKNWKLFQDFVPKILLSNSLRVLSVMGVAFVLGEGEHFKTLGTLEQKLASCSGQEAWLINASFNMFKCHRREKQQLHVAKQELLMGETLDSSSNFVGL